MTAAAATALPAQRAAVGLIPALITCTLCAGVFFAPYLTWRPFDIMFTLSDMMFCGLAMLMLFGGGGTSHPFGALTPWWMFAFVALAIGLLIGSLVNGDPLRWAIGAAQYGFALVVLPCLLIGHGRVETVRMAKALLAGVIAMEIFGIAIYFLYPASFEEYRQFGLEFISGSRRLGVFLSDANWNGAYLAMSLPFVGYLYAKRLIPGWQALLAAAVMIEGLLLAASVSALVCATLSAAALIVIGGMKVPRFAIVAAAVGLVACIATGMEMPQAFSVRVAPAIASGDLAEAGTFSGRLDLIHEALGIAEHTSLVGLGVDGYREISASLAPVHNIYLLLWCEGGLIALAGWLLLLIVLFCVAAHVYRQDRMTAALGLSVLTTLVVSSTASPHMYARLWVVPMFVAMAFVFECAAASRGKTT
jgi:O-antigen ligase